MEIYIDGDKYLNDTDVINLMGISTRTFYQWIEKEKINPPDRFNSRGWRMWNKQEVDSAIALTFKVYTKNELENNNLEPSN